MNNIAMDACTYASLILIDDSQDITSINLEEKINTILKAANITFVSPLLSSMFSRVLSNSDPRQLLMNKVNSADQVSVAVHSFNETVQKEEEKEQESSSENEDDLGFALFD
jgi:ribosomal protein L12E/L44/L45/RPP1/RPP2